MSTTKLLPQEHVMSAVFETLVTYRDMTSGQVQKDYEGRSLKPADVIVALRELTASA